jgi:hypothetical protein
MVLKIFLPFRILLSSKTRVKSNRNQVSMGGSERKVLVKGGLLFVTFVVLEDE